MIRPLLLSKGRSMVALYGLGNIRDERLHRAFQNRKVRFEVGLKVRAASGFGCCLDSGGSREVVPHHDPAPEQAQGQ